MLRCQHTTATNCKSYRILGMKFRRTLVFAALLTTSLPFALSAQDGRYQPDGEIIPGPEKPADSAEWLAQLKRWRYEKLIRMGYNGAEYDRPELKWSQRNFVQPQSMVEDRYLYDPVTRKYTVNRFLDDFDKRYGGIDSVLLWPVYPNIGIDNRNEFDLHRDLPGGVAEVKAMIEEFHRRGVKVFFPTMPWDVGTRDPGTTYWDAAAAIVAETGADGINGDTFSGIPAAYKTATDKAGHPVVLDPENALAADEMIAWNAQSWGYWRFPWVPGVSRYKWIEPRHMVNICDRWTHDKTNHLQAAFFNGVGFESWENIWGIWNQMSARDAEALRRVAKIERRFAPYLVSPGWEPHTPVLQYGIFASKWPGDQGTLWTLVNRNPYDLAGQQITLPAIPGMRYFDLYQGVELTPESSTAPVTLSFPLEAGGFGAILATAAPPRDLASFLSEMKTLTARPLRSYSKEWSVLPQQIAEIAKTSPAQTAPQGMLEIPAASYEFRVSGIMIEGGNDEGVDVQYPWEPSARRHHRHTLQIASFYVDKFPVTNADFKKFLDATHYQPGDAHNFLRDWNSGVYPSGWDNRPVTWVSLEDARAYAKWAGKRLPHEWEWQYAAQGSDGRIYPWGNEWDSAAVPAQETARTMRPPTSVDAYPKGASPFGVMDMVGNVWQWTDEYLDEHTRAGIVRGGTYYKPQGSMWYFPNTYKLTEHGKYLLMAPSKDRAGTLGFRCVKDR
jgi:iron(II)-dependent oxidoreductase